MAKFKKKPVTINAVQWTGKNFEEIQEFLQYGIYTYDGDQELIIYTLEGNHKASIGDWIIRGVAGEFYPCKPDIFQKTYEEDDSELFLDLDSLWVEAKQEAKRAMDKFPQPNYVALKVAEEGGEVIKAAVHYAEGRDTAEHVRQEIIQNIAMLCRFYVEGDQRNGIPPIAFSTPTADDSQYVKGKL